MNKKSDDQFSKKEADDRLAMALRGARMAKPTPMESIPPKRANAATQKTKPVKKRGN